MGELNKTIAELVERLNTRAFKKIEGNRRSRFEALELPTLKPLPTKPYEFGEWKKAKVHPDYHIEVARAYYSVPYRLIGQRVDVRLTARAVEIFHSGELVAAHPRAKERAQRFTRRVHRPEKHIAIIDQHIDRVLERAFLIGPATFGVVQAQARSRKHPEETLRSAQGILRLAHDFSAARLEAACERALALKASSYRAVRTLILRTRTCAELSISNNTPLKESCMLTEPLIQQLHRLHLTGMAAALEQQLAFKDSADRSFEDRIGMMIQQEFTERASHRLAMRLRWAKLTISACIEDIDTRSPRGLDPAQLAQVSDLAWIREHLNVLITGPTGIGKSYLGAALAHSACRADFSVRCFIGAGRLWLNAVERRDRARSA